MALCLQHGQRERGILRGQFRAVVKAGLRPHRETIGQLVRRNLHRLRSQAVHRIGLVAGARHQRREDHVHALRAFTLEDVGVERIEREDTTGCRPAPGNQREQSAFRRVGIDVVEMVKVGRIFQVAEHRHAVNVGFGHRRPPRGRNRAALSAPTPRPSTCRRENSVMRPKSLQLRLPILAALSASHHHRFGKPEARVFRQRFGMAEAIPSRVTLEAEGELRHHVEVPQQHAIHRLAVAATSSSDPWQR